MDWLEELKVEMSKEGIEAQKYYNECFEEQNNRFHKVTEKLREYNITAISSDRFFEEIGKRKWLFKIDGYGVDDDTGGEVEARVYEWACYTSYEGFTECDAERIGFGRALIPLWAIGAALLEALGGEIDEG